VIDSSSSINEFCYAFKSSLIGAPLELQLTDDALEWRRGSARGRAPYRRIRRVRLSFRPMTMQNYRFLTELWPADGPKLQIASTSWKSMFEHERLDAQYVAFVTELSRRIGHAGGQASFECGSLALIYWPGVAVLVGATIAIVALAVRALQTGAFAGTAFIGAFLALLLWQAGAFFLRNRPGTFRPDAVPPLLLPRS
jgi:hypothetical protein